MVILKVLLSFNRKERTAILSFLLFLFSAVISCAEIPDDFSEADELLLFQDMNFIASASRQKQPANLLSVPVSVLTAEDLHYSGHTSIAETLQYVPGVDVVRMDRNRYAVGIRGLQGMFSDRTMTLVDGIPADSPAFGGPEFTSLTVMMEDIDRIEIVRGPGGAAWGPNALSGVVNIITKKPDQVPGLFFTSSLSEFGDSSSQVRYANSTGKWSWLLSAGYNDSKSSRTVLDLSAEEGGGDFQRKKLARGELVYQNEAELEISMGAGATSTDAGAFETAGVFLEQGNALNTANGYFKVSKTFSPDTEAYLRWVGRYQDMYRPSYGGAKYHVKEHDVDGQVSMTGLANHSLAFGGNFRSTDLSARPVQPEVFTLADEYVNEHWFGIFGSDRYQYSKQLFFEAQLRGDYFSEGETGWSGRFSSLYGIDPSMTHVLRLSAAKSYRQPIGFIRDALYYTDPQTSGFLYHFSVDPAMDSEQAWSLEGGYHWKIQEYLQFKGELYYMWYKDLIGAWAEYGLSAAGSPEAFIIVGNTGDADGYGCELELEYEYGSLLWRLWYAYNDFETEYPFQSIRSFLPAKNKVGFTLRWHIDERWTVNSQYAYSDLVREDVTGDSVDMAHHLDLTLAMNFLEQRGEVMIGVMDLFNKDYDPVVGLDQTSGNRVPGRTFFCRLQYRF